LFLSFCMASNLRALLSSHSSPEILHLFGPFLETSNSGTDTLPLAITDLGFPVGDTDDVLCADATDLPALTYDALLHRLNSDPALSSSVTYRHRSSRTDAGVPVLNPKATILRSVVHKGRRYTDASHNVGDSQVLFTCSSPNRPSTYGRIQSIFVHRRYSSVGVVRRQVFAAVARFSPLSDVDARSDPYRRYVGLGAHLVYADLAATIEVIPVQDIISHFVSCPYE
ncbi:hypothetical protein GY45DRAFT_1209873, partial [Cubamyces sp. BRFM 1775]